MVRLPLIDALLVHFRRATACKGTSGLDMVRESPLLEIFMIIYGMVMILCSRERPLLSLVQKPALIGFNFVLYPI